MPQSLEQSAAGEGEPQRLQASQTKLNAVLLLVGIIVGAGLVAICWAIVSAGGNTTSKLQAYEEQLRAVEQTLQSQQESSKPPSMHAPTNVNFGGWLCLEDWFFSGKSGTEVSSLDKKGQGACLPPLLQGPLDEPWPSEGILVHRLVKSKGEEQTVNIFKAHRESYITVADLQILQSLGVNLVRIPMVWVAFADALKDVAPEKYGGFDANTESVVIPDPFYPDQIKYVTIPRSMLQEFFENCTDHGLKVLIDIHAFPGGAADGTYNGIWPLQPVFWTNKTIIGTQTSNINGPEAGQLIVQKMIQWVEGLPLKAFSAIGGITVMNEPAHLMGTLFGHTLDVSKVVLPWLAKAGEHFRQSTLPSRGVKLYMNLIETAFLPLDFWEQVSDWWTSEFTDAERKMWAVFDLHHYLAWAGPGGKGSGTNDGDLAKDHFRCNDAMADVDGVLESEQNGWAKGFASRVTGLKASTEYSLSTAHTAAHACGQRAITGSFFAWQVASMKKHDIEPFFWTWRMPFGPNFQAAWSYKFHMGRETPYPSGSNDPCLATNTTGLDFELIV